MATTPNLTRFKGLNNVTDPLRLDLGWLVRADNVDITDTGAIEAREGYTRSRQLLGASRGVYGTDDLQRLYSIEGDSLVSVKRNLQPLVLRTGLSAGRYSFAEINDQVFFSNGADSGIINQDDSMQPWAWTHPDAPLASAVTGSLDAGRYQVRVVFVLPDGRVTGASEPAVATLDGASALQIANIPQVAGHKTNVYVAPANATTFYLAARNAPASLVWNSPASTLGEELRTVGLDPLPAGSDIVQFWNGRAFAAMYMPGSADQSVVWMSQALMFHLFKLDSDGFIVKGRVLMMAAHDDALIIGTDRAIFAFTGEKIQQLANYGVISGRNFSVDPDSGRLIFWSERGACQALPFKNLTDQQVSVPPGIFAGGSLVHRGGRKRYLVSLQQGGNAFNPL